MDWILGVIGIIGAIFIGLGFVILFARECDPKLKRKEEELERRKKQELFDKIRLDTKLSEEDLMYLDFYLNDGRRIKK